jgi:tetratricopeptide (TPR) repeat protein
MIGLRKNLSPYTTALALLHHVLCVAPGSTLDTSFFVRISTSALLVLFLASCTGIEVLSDITEGRRYLMRNEPERALVSFQKVAVLQPRYVTNFTDFPENISTYIGRAYYDLGQLAQARAAFERSVTEHHDAILGHVYLGLVEMRQGEVQRGLQNALNGLHRLQVWFSNLEAHDYYADLWDTNRVVRTTTAQLTQEIEKGDVPWQRIAPKLAQLGPQMDREIDLEGRRLERALTPALNRG